MLFLHCPRSKSEGTCYSCNSPGHYASSCPNKKIENNNTTNKTNYNKDFDKSAHSPPTKTSKTFNSPPYTSSNNLNTNINQKYTSNFPSITIEDPEFDELANALDEEYIRQQVLTKASGMSG